MRMLLRILLRFDTDCFGFCFGGLNGFGEVFVGKLQIKLLSHLWTVAKPAGTHMGRMFLYEFRLACRATVLKDFGPALAAGSNE